MKNKIVRYLGVVLILAVLAGLLVPAVPAAAANMAWGAVNTPSTTSNILVPGGNGAGNWLMEVAADGKTIFAYDNNAMKLYKSVDGGVTFTSTGVGTGIVGPVVALAVSANFAADSVVLAASATAVYASSNAGATFSAILPNTTGIGGGTITSVDAAAHYNGAGTAILVGTTAGAAILVPGSVFGSAFTATGMPTGEAVQAVAFSPNFKTDGMLFFVTSNATGSFVESVRGPTAVNAAFASTNITTAVITGAAFAFPADYNVDSNNVFFVGTKGANGDAYRVRIGTSATDLGVSGASTTTDINSVSFKGNAADGYLYVGGTNGKVYRATATTASTVTFTPSTKLYGTSVVVAASPVAADTNIFAMTSGAGSAFQVSTDGAVTFNLMSLIGVSALANVNIIGMTMVDANTVYMIMQDTAAATSILFKTVNAGTNWVGVWEATGANQFDNVYVSPAYATDNTVYLTYSLSAVVWKSANAGNTFSSLFTANGANVTAFAPIDATNFFVAGSAGVYKGTAFTAVTTPGTVTAINRVSATNMFVGNTAGGVYQSTNDGTSFTAIGAPGIGASVTAVLADAAFATNNTVYAASASGIYRFVVGTSTAWTLIKSGTINGLAMQADGTLYASTTDSSVALYRSINPTSPATTWDVMTGVTGISGFPSGATTADVNAFATGSATVPNNTLYVIVNGLTTGTASGIYTFQDTMVAAPAVTAPAANASVTNPVTLTWVGLNTAASAAPTYTWTLGTDSNFIGANSGTTAGTTFFANDLIPGQTYYWKVQGTAPLHTKVSAVTKFGVKLAQFGNTLALNAPTAGATGVSTKPVLQWTGVDNAASYNLQVADNPVFVNPVDNQTGLNTTVWTETKTLTANTTYYWRVQAVSATGVTSDWISGSFTTAAAAPTTTSTVPAATQPAITITTVPQPTIIVTVPPQSAVIPTITVTSQAAAPETPATIWAVIAIGAILVIAVIVLIARTRRV